MKGKDRKSASECLVGALVFLNIIFSLAFWKGTAQAKEKTLSYKAKTIRVVMDDDYPPFIFKDSEGHLRGILPDLWHLWEKKTGIHVQITATDWEEAKRRMLAGEFDVIDTIFRNKERDKIFAFSKPYAKVAVPIIFRSAITGIKSVKDLRGFPVAVKSGDNDINVLRAHGVNHLIEFDNYKDIVEAARDHKVNVFVIDKPPALYYLYKFGISDQFHITHPLYTGEFHRAVLKGNRALLQVVDNGFAKISQDQFNKIEERWYGAPILPPKIQHYLRIGMVVVALILLCLFFWVWGLRRLVGQRTAALQQEVQSRLKQETLLREEEEKYRSLFNNSEVGMFRSKSDGSEVLEVNQKFLDLLGKKRDEVIGKPVSILLVKKGECEGLLQILMKYGQIIEYETKFLHEKKGTMDFIISIKFYRENESIEWSVIDITECRKTVEALRHLTIRQEALLAAITDIIMEVDTNKVYIWANSAGIEFFGEDVVGKPVAYFFEDEQDTDEIVRPVFEGKEKVVYVESWQRRKDGKARLLAWWCKALRNKNGKITGTLSTARDITDRKNLELDLAKREREYRTLVKNFPDLIVRYNTKLQRIYVNPAWEKATGIPARYALDKGLMDNQQSPFSVNPVYINTIDKVLSTKISQSVEFSWVNDKGLKLFIEFHVIPEFNEHREIESVLSIGRDITNLKRSLQRVIAEQQLVNDMVFKLSLTEERERRRIASDLHDTIGQDLALARIKLGEARKTIGSGSCKMLDESCGILEKAIGGVRHLTMMISPPILEGAGLESALKWLARQMEDDYGLKVIFNDDMQYKQIIRDSQIQVYNSVRELLINIAKHAKTDEAEMTLCRIGDFFVAKIEDSGIGFNFDHTKQYYTINSFGLFNVQRIIASIGGSFTIDSKPDQGTCVTIKIPIPPGQVDA